MDPISLISIGAGLFQGGMKMFAPGDNSSAANVYSNRLAENQARIRNAQLERAANRAAAATQDQLLENRDAAYRAMSQEQARFNEQLQGFAFGRQSLIRNRILAQGQAAASERYGNSARRISNVDVLGEYGRQNAMFSENVASAGRQYVRGMDSLARQRYDADRTAVGSLAGQLEGYTPVMAQTTYNNPYNNNTALKIGGGLMEGIIGGFSFDKMLRG